MYETPYLIQRMNFKKNPEAGFGIEALLSMDYMGSAEFEFGALANALKVMCSTADKLEVAVIKDVVSKKGQRLYLVLPKGSADNYRPVIDELAAEKIRLKAFANFTAHLTGTTFMGRELDENGWRGLPEAWWDLDNNVMFTFGKKNAENILKAIRNVRDRKKDDGEAGWF